VLDGWKAILPIYSVHLGGILVSWYSKPIKRDYALTGKTTFVLAVLCTIVFNCILLFVIGHGYLQPERDILTDLQNATTLAVGLSFVIAPVNWYYFGIQSSGSNQGGGNHAPAAP